MGGIAPNETIRPVPISDGDTLLTTPHAAKAIGLQPRRLERLRSQGKGPKYEYLFGRVWYRLSNLTTWAASRAPPTTQKTGYPLP